MTARIDAFPRFGLRRAVGDRRNDTVADDDGRVLLEPDPLVVVMHEGGAAGDHEIGCCVGHPTTLRRGELDAWCGDVDGALLKVRAGLAGKIPVLHLPG